MRRADGFSLVELLVVVAVLSLLISIMAPALTVARSHARASVCASNVRQMGVGGLAHLNDHGYYPPDLGGTIWPLELLPYVGDRADVFHCPDAPGTARWDGRPWTTAYHLTPFSYSIDCWGAADSYYLGWWVPGGHPTPARTQKEITKPGNFYWIGDSNHGNAEDPGWLWDFIFEVHAFDWCAPTEWIGQRHFGGTNMVYADGHSEWILRDDIMKAGTLPVGDPDRIYWRRKDNFDNRPHEEYWH